MNGGILFSWKDHVAGIQTFLHFEKVIADGTLIR